MRSALNALGAVVAFLLMAGAAGAQPAGDQSLSGDAGRDDPEQLAGMPIDELDIRVLSLSGDSLAELRSGLLDDVRASADLLGEALIERLRLERDGAADADSLFEIDQRVSRRSDALGERVSRLNVVLDASELRGIDVASERAFLRSIDVLQGEATAAATSESAVRESGDEKSAALLERVNELISIVRAEPPANERPVPWDVPVAEVELELQPLPTEQVLERLERWRQLLQGQVRQRVRIDILLNNPKKLEQARSINRAALGLKTGEGRIGTDEIKAELADRSQEVQRTINAIVKRMEVAIRLVEIRGGDASSYQKYVKAATGQRLNIADADVLAAQVRAWLMSRDGGQAIAMNLGKFLAVAVAFWLLSRILGRLTSIGVRRVPRSSSLLAPVLAGTVRRLTFLIGLVIAVSMLGVNIGPLLAVIGAAGLVIGLALQGTLSNFASGVLILLNKPYDVGDVINAGGVFGKVEAMNLVSTSILTFDNQVMLVPNNEIWNSVITNVTGKQTRRVDLKFGIGYADDMHRAMEIISEVVSGDERVLRDPAPLIRVHELGDNSVNIITRPWVKTGDYWDVYWDTTKRVKARFDEEGINIPFPQRDLHLDGPIEIKLTDGDGGVPWGAGIEPRREEAASGAAGS